MFLDKILVGNDFGDRNYSVKSIEDVKQDKSFKKQNIWYFVNIPDLPLTAEMKGYTGQLFTKMRAFFIDIDPVKQYKEALTKENADLDTWYRNVEEEINNIKNQFKRYYDKLPTVIMGSGLGIHIVLELEEEINRDDLTLDEIKSIIFMHKLVETFLSERFEIDDAVFSVSTTTFWSNTVVKKSKLPIEQKVVKYNGADVKKGVKYTSKTNNINVNETKFDVKTLILPDKQFLIEGLEFTKEDKNASREEAILSILDKLRTHKSYQPKNDTDRKLIISCINTNHTDSNPSAVFFKDTGVFHCKGCGITYGLVDTYKIVVGKDLIFSDKKLLSFENLDRALCKYSSQKDGDSEYCFLIDGQEIWLPINDWSDQKLQIFCANNQIVGFTPKLKTTVIDNVLKRCIQREVPYIQRHRIQINSDLIILAKNRCYILKNDSWVRNDYFDVIDGLNFGGEYIEKTDGYKKQVYAKLQNVNSPEYNLTMLTLVINAILMGTFEQRYKLHPLTYIYGMKDTGKSSMIILALSIIAENYQQLVAGATSLHTILQQLADKDYIPVLIDEFHKFDKIRDTVIQMLKDIATNGGKFVKGTVATRTMLEEYRLKASPILASEFRDQLIDPSFYQRCIELNLNDFPRINLKKSMEFNELLDMDKTFIFLDLLNFITRNAKPLSEDEIIQMFPDYDLLEGKKRSSSFLQIISYLLAANFYKSVGLDYTGKVKNVINVYLENEVKQNSKTARVASISEEAMSSIFAYVKVDPALILNNIHIEVLDTVKEVVSIKTWRGFLTGKQLNFRNEHLLNELSCKPKTVKSAGGRAFTSNISIEVSLPNIVTLVELLIVYSGNQPEAVINMAQKQKDTLMKIFNISKSKWNILSGAEDEIILNKQEPAEVKTEVINGLFGKPL